MVRLFIFCLLVFSTGLFANEPIRHTIDSDGHSLVLWEKSAINPRAQILLLHGRTWSSLPDFDLQVPGEALSFMDGLTALGFRVYALDARGYGATPRDDTGWLTPDRAARDVANVVQWINESRSGGVHLFGWSYGSMVGQLMAQRNPTGIKSLILFGYPYDLDRAAAEAEHDYPEKPPALANTAENAASDFITPGSISQHAIDTYVEASLRADPVRVDFKDLHQWGELDATRVETPTLLLKAEFDPLTPMDKQADFFQELGVADKWFVVLPGGDHAALLETPRGKMLHSIDSFIRRAD